MGRLLEKIACCIWLMRSKRRGDRNC